MKKTITSIISAFAISLSLPTLVGEPAKALSTNEYIKISKDKTPIYENRKGVLEVVGYLNLNQQYLLNKDYNQNWFQIKMGNSLAYVSKLSSIKVKYPSYKNVNVKYKNSKKTIKTITNTPVYDNTSGKLVDFATIKENRRYPVLYKAGNWWVVDISGRIGFIHNSKVKEDKGVPVLMYHHLLKASENTNHRNNQTVTPEEFKAQMDYLHQRGYETITTGQLEQYIRGNLNLPAKTVLVTFDDGLKSVYLYAYPILKANNMKATEFMITSRVTNTPSNFNPKKLQTLSKTEMARMSDVFEFQGHTNNLHNIDSKKRSMLLSKTSSQIKQDLTLNKKFLNAKVFSYPFGQSNFKTVSALKQVGFTSAYTMDKGYVNIGDDVYKIKRFGIEPGMSLTAFKDIFEK